MSQARLMQRRPWNVSSLSHKIRRALAAADSLHRLRIDELSKIMLIVIGVAPTIILDSFNLSKAVPNEQS